MKYFSFLVCQHEHHADIYINGHPVGQIIEGENQRRQFVPHQLTDAKGDKREVYVGSIPGSPFKSMHELTEYLAKTHEALFEQ